jgi:senataxin
LDSKEERGGTSLANSTEAHLAVHLFSSLRNITRNRGLGRVAVITPYSEQASLLRNRFTDLLGRDVGKFVEINTVDAFQGRESNVVIFSAVRAAGSRGIGFLSDVRRMNVALTRAKHFLFVIARCQSIIVNPYWADLVSHARETNAVVRVPILQNKGNSVKRPRFGELLEWKLEKPVHPKQKTADPRVEAKRPAKPTDPRQLEAKDPHQRGEKSKPTDPRKLNLAQKPNLPKPIDPRKRRRLD